MNKTFYTFNDIDFASNAVARGEEGIYGLVDTWIRQAFSKYPVCRQDVLIFGSCNQDFGPWYEAMVCAAGGNPLATDYNEIDYADDSLGNFISLEEVMNPQTPPWPRILSISTFEHSGLGRYGDPIDPDGDLKAMELCRKIIQPRGLLYLAVPIGKDKVVGNMHRIYGVERLFKLLDGWRIIDTFGISSCENPSGFSRYIQDLNLHRDTFDGWCPKNPDGTELHPGLPEYSPILVLEKA